MKPRTLVTRQLPPAVMSRLANEIIPTGNPADRVMTKAEIIAAIPTCEALLPTITEVIDAEVIAGAPGLRVIANFGVGFNNIDVAAATARGIVVTNTPGVLTEATADIAFGLLIAASRRFSEGERLVRAKEWKGWGPLQLLGSDISCATLGLVGLGRIAQATARRAQGFGMRVIYWNRTRLSADDERRLGLEYRERDVLLSEADHVSLHVAYTPETHHLINAAALARMKPTAVLVNTARGAVIDEKALVAALRNGTIAAAGLDVFEREPQLDPELYDLPNCVLLPHLGSATIGTRTKMGMIAIDNLLAVFRGERPANCVNPSVLR
jgi:glyoxylate reductase